MFFSQRVARRDDLGALTVPEPVAALLGLIGMLAVRRQP